MSEIKENSQDKDKKQSAWLKIIIIILVIIFFGGVIIGGISLVDNEGVFEQKEEYVEGKNPWPHSKEEIANYFYAALKQTELEKPKIVSETEIDISDDEIKFDDNASDGVIAVAQYIKDNVADAVAEDYKSVDLDFGENNTGKLQSFSFTHDDILNAECSCEYYICPNCEEEVDEYAEKCPECSADMKKEKHYRDNYKIVIEFPEEKFPIASDSVLSENFSPRSKEELDRLIKNKFKKYFATSNEKIEYSEIKISAEINRFTNEIQNLSLSKKMNVSSDIAFAGELEYLGKTSCSFVAEENLKYEFTFPKVVLSKNELSIKTKTDDSLEAALTAPQGIKAKWSTSDDSIVSVDEDGYIKTHKNEGSAIVTVSFEFNGKTYSDTCKINVGTAVDGMKISEKKLKMDVGKTEKLTANVEPKNATIKEITWISINDKVAKVDNEGNVTATGKGSTIVYAVSVDGNYKASCEITVS